MMFGNIEVIERDLEGWRGEAWLCRWGDRYFVLSGVHVPYTGWEIMAFPCDEEGTITTWNEITGTRLSIDHIKFIAQIEDMGYQEFCELYDGTPPPKETVDFEPVEAGNDEEGIRPTGGVAPRSESLWERLKHPTRHSDAIVWSTRYDDTEPRFR